MPIGVYPRTPTADRFATKFKKGPGCWEWTGEVRAGYGCFWMDGRKWKSNRAAWTIGVGPIPGGVCVLHRCDNPLCVRISHLFLGTHADNAMDRERKGRGNAPLGSMNGLAKLTESKVAEMRERYTRGGVTQRELAIQYGVHQVTIGKALRGDKWKHVA